MAAETTYAGRRAVKAGEPVAVRHYPPRDHPVVAPQIIPPAGYDGSPASPTPNPFSIPNIS